MSTISNISTIHPYRVDLTEAPLTVQLTQPLSHQDALADTFIIAVRRGMSPIDLTGMAVTGYMTFGETRQTLPLRGSVQGSTASLTLTDDCYRLPGLFTLVMQLQDEDVRHTLLRVSGLIDRTACDDLIASDRLLPTLPELLDDIGRMEQATEDCRQAAVGAQEATAELNRVMSDNGPGIERAGNGPIVSLQDAAVRPALLLQTEIGPGPGVNALTLYHTGRNMFPGPRQIAINANTVRWGMEYTQPAVYTISATGQVTEQDYIYARVMDESGVVVGNIQSIADTISLHSRTITLQPGQLLHVWCLLDITQEAAEASIARTQLQVEIRDATPYQGGQGGSITVPLPETVYGGCYDWLKGQLTITHDASGAMLAQTRRHQLTPAPLTLLHRDNTLWSDTGVTHLRYIVDTERYVQEAVNSLTHVAHADFAEEAAQAHQAARAADAETVQGVDVLALAAGLAPGVLREEKGALLTLPDGSPQPVQRLTSRIGVTQAGSGDPAPDNVRPIRGWDAVTVTRTGRNLISAPFVQGIAMGIDSGRIVTYTQSGSWLARDMLLPPGTYTLSGPATAYVYAYDDTKAADLAVTKVMGTATPYTFTLAQATYIAVGGGEAAKDVYQLVCGAEVQEYEPRQGVTLSAALPETVYGGTLDWTKGLLTVTHHRIVLDGVTAGAKMDSTDNPGEAYAYIYSWNLPRALKYGSKAYGSRIRVGTNTVISISLPSGLTGVTATDPIEVVTAKYNAILKQWHEAGEPLEIVYEIAEPYTLSLDPQQLSLLRGENRVWSDAGDTEAAYIADTKLYIDSAIAAAITGK